MSKRVICDCCNDKTAEYTIEENVRARRWYNSLGIGSWKVQYDLCINCFDRIGAEVKKARLKRSRRKS